MTKNFKNSQVFHRMNFLSQCQEALMESDPAVSNLQAFYGHTLHILSRRTQSKMYPSLKRSMCKKCSTLLVPGTNATLRLEFLIMLSLCRTAGKSSTIAKRSVTSTAFQNAWEERLQADGDHVPNLRDNQEATVCGVEAKETTRKRECHPGARNE